MERIFTFVVPLNCGLLQRECGVSLDEPSSQLLLLASRSCSSTPSCGGSVYPFPCVFWEDLFQNIVADLLCPWEEVSSGSFYTTILNPLSKQNSFDIRKKKITKSFEYRIE